MGGIGAERKQGSFPVGHISGRNRNSVRQALGIDGNVTLDSRDLLAGVVAFLVSASYAYLTEFLFKTSYHDPWKSSRVVRDQDL